MSFASSEHRFHWSIFIEQYQRPRTNRCETDLVSHRDAESVSVVVRILVGVYIDYTPATILCLPWKGWTINSSRPIRSVDPLTADQKDQWRREPNDKVGEAWLFIFPHQCLYEKWRSNRSFRKVSCWSDLPLYRLWYGDL